MQIKLNYPITTPTGEQKELTLNRPKAKDLRAVGQFKDDAEREIHLFARLTGLMVEDIEELDLSDYAQLQKAFQEMVMGKSQA